MACIRIKLITVADLDEVTAHVAGHQADTGTQEGIVPAPGHLHPTDTNARNPRGNVMQTDALQCITHFGFLWFVLICVTDNSGA